MANETKLTNVVNPEVMADMIAAELPSKLKFAPLAEVDSTLEGVPGTTVTIPSWNYIGDAEDLTEAVAMGTVTLTSSTKNATIKEAGRAIEVSELAINSGKGDPIGEAKTQILEAIDGKVDSDCIDALETATLSYDGSAGIIGYETIVKAVDKFVEEDDEAKVLFIHPLQKGQLRLDEDFIKASQMGDAVIMTGTIGEIAGCQVVASNKIKTSNVYAKTTDVALASGKDYYTVADGVYTKVAAPDVEDIGTYYEVSKVIYHNFIVKQGALAIYLKQRPTIKSQEDILKRTTVLAASEYYVVALRKDSKVVKFTVATK